MSSVKVEQKIEFDQRIHTIRYTGTLPDRPSLRALDLVVRGLNHLWGEENKLILATSLSFREPGNFSFSVSAERPLERTFFQRPTITSPQTPEGPFWAAVAAVKQALPDEETQPNIDQIAQLIQPHLSPPQT